MSQAMYIYSADNEEVEQTFLATVFTTRTKAKEMVEVWQADYNCDIVVVDEFDNVVVSTEKNMEIK